MTDPGHLVAGRYRLRERIGGGGMGAVWLARDELLGRDVAVKQVLPPAGSDPGEAEQQRARALREGRIAARLSHPHAISVYDVALENDQPWLVMEHLPSLSLAAVLSEEGVLRVDQVAQIGAQVADALAATHAAGIVHRDVKPANVLIGRGERVEGLVKITDFGISHAQGDVTLTQTGQITGTPAFLAPEVARGVEPGPASDVFSLGATLYTCLEGAPPFGMRDNALQQLHRVAAGRVDPPQRSGQLTEPLLRMLSDDADARPTMVQVRDELARLAAGRDGDTATVLRARTDLTAPGGVPAQRSATERIPRTAAAERGATTGQPVPAPAARRATAPAPAPPPDRPTPPPTHDPAGRPRDRRRARRWAVAAVAAVLAGLVVLGVVLTDGAREDAAQQTPPAASTPASPPGPTDAGDDPPTPADTSSPAGTPAAPTSDPPDEPFQAEAVTAFLGDYHELVPGDPTAAYALTGPSLRARVGPEDYAAFWGGFEGVELRDVDAEDGEREATGELVYSYPDGTTQTELTRFSLTTGEDGELLLDGADSVQVLDGRG